MITKTIAIDFDGTLCETKKFPLIGEPRADIIELCKELRSEGHTLILWTCRAGKSLENAVEWCFSFGLEFDAINTNLKNGFNEESRKVNADLYVDDKACTPRAFLARNGR